MIAFIASNHRLLNNVNKEVSKGIVDRHHRLEGKRERCFQQHGKEED